ncbi:SESN protein, partial [Pseudoatta argentina]
MSIFVPNKVYLRGILLHYFIQKKSAAEAHRILVQTYGDNALSDTTCRDWFRRFKNNDFQLEDKERSGAPKKCQDKELEQLLDEDPSQTLSELGKIIQVDESTVSKRLKGLGMIQKQGHWVPYELKPRSTASTAEKKSSPDIAPSDFHLFTHVLLMDAFLQNNRLDHVSRVMSSHPSYLEHFLRTQQFVLRGDGPLPYDYRHLIAIMAAGRHQCSYLINLQKGEFLLQGGDPSWLQGLRSIPGKLQDLYEINKILAHRPWLLNKSHIEKLTKGDDNWSLAEVVHAIVLLAHFHSLSSFVFSCGINEELDNVTGHHYKENIQDNSSKIPPAKDKLMSPKKIPNGDGKTENLPSPPSSPSIVGEQEVGVETLMERMKRLSEKSESYQITQEELSKRFETVETQSAELAAAPQRSSSVLDSDIGLFIEDPTFIYQDFAKRGQLNDIPTFRVQDYSWDDHGYSLVNRLYNDVGNLLDDKFKTAYNLTYYTMGTHNKVDTSRFRRAIWNYIQCMFGIRHDDYDYNEVNQLLERSLKTFIKSAVCYPERVTKRDYDRVMREFKHSEKVHVNLMILEARMQAELLYALRAVMRYMT